MYTDPFQGIIHSVPWSKESFNGYTDPIQEIIQSVH